MVGRVRLLNNCLYGNLNQLRERKKRESITCDPEEVILDCCSQPDLNRVRTISEDRHDLEALQQCRKCKTYWFYRYNEYVTFDYEDWTCWYTRLSSEEGERILRSEERPDLTFLKKKESFMEDSQGVRKVSGQPTEPWH